MHTWSSDWKRVIIVIVIVIVIVSVHRQEMVIPTRLHVYMCT